MFFVQKQKNLLMQIILFFFSILLISSNFSILSGNHPLNSITSFPFFLNIPSPECFISTLNKFIKLSLSSEINKIIKMNSFDETYVSLSDIETIFCIAGNDGTGKSTICNFINHQLRSHSPSVYCIERSHKSCPKPFEPLLKELKQLDKITFNYAFEDERKNFKQSHKLTVKYVDSEGNDSEKEVKVFWFMLDLQPQKIKKRLQGRKVVDIYDSKKAVQYYSFIYREFAWYYGIPIIYADQPTSSIIRQIIFQSTSQFYSQVHAMKYQSIDLLFVNQRNVQKIIAESFTGENHLLLDTIYQLVKHNLKCSKTKELYFGWEEFNHYLHSSENIPQEELLRFKVSLTSRWLVKFGCIKTLQQNILEVSFQNHINGLNGTLRINNFSSKTPYLKISEEGESKILFTIHSSLPQVEEYFKGKVVILLKSTIYSHTKQHTGEIENLGKIRALGNILFLEMMRRNNLNHAYLCINHENGIILSQLVKTNMLEIVFKKQCLGTDKHSYHEIQSIDSLVNKSNNCYSSGVYIRFDWRNPNHYLTSNPNQILNLDPYYYVVEKFFGKQTFFKSFLTNPSIIPMGDKCITEDLISQYAPTEKIKKNTLKVYATFLHYARNIGLQILDGCMMFDSEGDTVWSEINPDCMRIKSIKEKQDYDKDIWRYGGSSKKEKIVEKWKIFNKLFIDWFQKNRFNETQLIELPQLCYPYQQVCRQILAQNNKISKQYQHIYRQLSSTKADKRLIGTIDISDSKPTLVKSSQLTEFHSNSSLEKAYEHISLLQEIVLVDIDAAIGKENRNNRSEVKELVDKDRSKVLAVGGGIRNEDTLNFYLNEVKCNKIILSSNLQLLKLLKPSDVSKRVIIQLSINQKNEILIKGRSINTKVNIIQKIIKLIEYGVKTISITFNNSEGHLNGIPRKQMIDIYSQIPWHIQNIIIAGGITTIDDLNFIWSFKRCIPQLGSAIWKNKLSISDIYQSLVKFNQEGLITSIIVDENDKILGQVYLNNEAMRLCCETRKLHRFSRQHRMVMKKGQTSGNIFNILNFKLDCDNDSIIIRVKPQSKEDVVFCHRNQYSCFQQYLKKDNLNALQLHILKKKQTGSGYTKRIMENQGLAEMKILQEIQQLHLSQTNKIHEASDLIAHLVMYMSSHKISTKEILTQLQRRSIDTIKLQQSKAQTSILSYNSTNSIQKQSNKPKSPIKMVGIIGGKHFQRIDNLTQKMIGIKLIRATNRSSKINYQIIDESLFQKYFSHSNIKLVGIKSKDMSAVVAKGMVSSCVNYSIMMQNYPIVCREIVKLPSPGIILALLGRKSDEINPKSWTKNNKGIIICEYPYSVNKYFQAMGIDENCYTLIRVSGGTQSYMASQDFKAHYCDAIVQSGKTVQDNNLKIVATLEQTIYAGLYQAL